MKKLFFLIFISIILLVLAGAGWSDNAIRWTGFENNAINTSNSTGLTWTDEGTAIKDVNSTSPVLNGTYSFKIADSGGGHGGVINRTGTAYTDNTISIWINSRKVGGAGYTEFYSGTNRDGTYMAYTLQQSADCPTLRICTYDGTSWATAPYNYTTNTWQRQIFVVNSSGIYLYYNNQSGFVRFMSATSIGTWTLQDNSFAAFDNIAVCSGSNFNCGLDVEAAAIEVTLNSPANNSQTTTNFTIYNATITPNTYNLTNATLNIWFNNGTLFTTNTTTLSGNSANTTTWNISFSVPSTYLWNVLGVQGNSNGTNSSFASANFTRRFSLVETNQFFFNPLSYETTRESFIVNITSNGTAPTNAFLLYSSSVVTSATITSLGNNFYNISANATIPTGVSNNSFYFNFTLGGLEVTSDTNYQDVLNTSLLMESNTTCDAGYLPYLNFSFADENNLSVLNGINDATIVYYWLGDGTAYKTLTTSNTSSNPYYLFCLQPQNRTLTANVSFQYSVGGYPTRNYLRNLFSLTNSTTNQTLYLLSSSDGIYVTFQVLNPAGQALSGVIANITRTIGGSTVIIGAGTTGSDGIITYWLDPDNLYTANFFHPDYQSFTTTQQFTQTGYTITLGAESTASTDLTQGISRLITPTSSFLDRDTLYQFSYALNSTFWTVDEFGFSLYYTNNTLIGSNSSTSNGGNLSFSNVNTTNASGIYMNFYYLIDGNYTNSTRNWIIQSTEGRDYSIWNFFSRLGTYIDSADGFLGIDNFGRLVIVLGIIILSVGLASTRYGIASEAAIMVILFSVVFFLDVGLGFIPQIQIGTVQTPQYALTALTFLITAVMLFREET